jgi:hypothetical protein
MLIGKNKRDFGKNNIISGKKKTIIGKNNARNGKIINQFDKINECKHPDRFKYGSITSSGPTPSLFSLKKQ